MPLVTPKRAIKAIFVISAIGFIMVDVSILLRDDETSSEVDVAARNQIVRENQSGPTVNISVRRERFRTFHVGRNHSNGSVLASLLPRVSRMNGNLSEIRAAMLAANRRQRISNLDLFDLVSSDSAVVIVVQVHDRSEYLHHLVSSLRKAVDIEQTLIVFSHDFYSDELNDIVASIDFCPVRYIHTVNSIFILHFYA